MSFRKFRLFSPELLHLEHASTKVQSLKKRGVIVTVMYR